jgi:hypothetical protein
MRFPGGHPLLLWEIHQQSLVSSAAEHGKLERVLGLEQIVWVQTVQVQSISV